MIVCTSCVSRSVGIHGSDGGRPVDRYGGDGMKPKRLRARLEARKSRPRNLPAHQDAEYFQGIGGTVKYSIGYSAGSSESSRSSKSSKSLKLLHSRAS